MSSSPTTMSFGSMYTHNSLPPSNPLFGRQSNTYATSINNNPSHTSTTSPYYHHIQPPPLAVIEQSHQTMAQKGTTQWSDNRLNTMFTPVSSFTPYQQSNGSIHNIVAMDEKIQKPLYSQHSMPTHPAPTLPPPQNHPGVDMTNAATMVANRPPTRQLTNSKRAAQNRAAQRAFRQRKDRYIKDLEAKAKELETTKKQLETLQKEKAEMAVIIRNLKNENAKLKGEEVVDDDNRHNGNNSSTGTNSSYSHYNNSSRNDDESQGLGEEPWLRHRDSVRKEALNRPGSGLTDTTSRGSNLVLPGPNTDSTVEPIFRPDYRHPNSNSPSPPSSASSDRNRSQYAGSQNNNNNGRAGYSSNDEDTDRVYDDLCELLKTRSRPALPQNLGRRVS
ncbi:putative transcription factor kapC [Rhizophagus clarus]|uniref:Putative transcription factor kapC n=1 Tax=Rhizophagus clarus TaxID=94130 RepID=A0A8H3LPW1_9GLOM|nr:putative transcription factor kapC [Rhizophagus clarus]